MSDQPRQPRPQNDRPQGVPSPSDRPGPQRSLSEISHLFLSDLRHRQTGGATPPRRKPPVPRSEAQRTEAARPTHSIDLSPEEFAAQFQRPRSTPVQVVLAAHLGAQQTQRATQLARHMAADGERIGLLIVDSDELRVLVYDHQPDSEPAPAATGSFNSREIIQVLEELSCDVDRWLILPCNPRLPEARTLLHHCDGWILLSSTDHDGVVAGYRCVKSLAEHEHPELSVALLDVSDHQQAQRVFHKLSGVCRQFLNWPVRFEAAIRAAEHVVEHVLIHFHGGGDKAQLAAGAVWLTAGNWVRQLMARRQADASAAPAAVDDSAPMAEDDAALAADLAPQRPMQPPSPAETTNPFRIGQRGDAPSTGGEQHLADVVLPESASVGAAPAAQAAPVVAETGQGASIFQSAAPLQPGETASLPAAPRMQPAMAVVSGEEQVVELAGEGSADDILSAVVQRDGTLVEVSIRPPSCPQARLAVSPQRRLVLLAVADRGLADLARIGRAIAWINENRALLAMALPQLAIDRDTAPLVQLYIDHGDARADALQVLLAGGQVSLHTWRRLRWGQRRALLLEAA